jgi:hypothetical protein
MRKPSSGWVSIITTSNFPQRELREFESKPTQVCKCSQDYASRCKSRTWSLRISPIWGAEGGDAWGLYSAYAQYFRGVGHGLCDSMRLLVPWLKIPRMAGYRLLHAMVPIQEGERHTNLSGHRARRADPHPPNRLPATIDQPARLVQVGVEELVLNCV